MTNIELQHLVEEISLKFFNKLFKHQAIFNHRLKSTGGRYHLKDHHLDFNPKVLEIHGLDTLIGIIKHELCHYHLHLDNKGYQHRNQEFKQLLAETGGLRYTPKVQTSASYRYQCQSCGQLYERFKRVNISKYRCGKCRGMLSPIQS